MGKDNAIVVFQEIENPELAQKRMKEIYQAKGYSDDWIEKRVRGIAIRDELTDEWKKRDVKTEREYSILPAEISKATFGMTPSEYKEFKGLKKENLQEENLSSKVFEKYPRQRIIFLNLKRKKS